MESLFHTLTTELVMHCNYKTADPTRANLLDYTEVPAQNRRSAIALQCRQPTGSFDLTRPVKPHIQRRSRDDTPQQSPRKLRAAVDG